MKRRSRQTRGKNLATRRGAAEGPRKNRDNRDREGRNASKSGHPFRVPQNRSDLGGGGRSRLTWEGRLDRNRDLGDWGGKQA